MDIIIEPSTDLNLSLESRIWEIEIGENPNFPEKSTEGNKGFLYRLFTRDSEYKTDAETAEEYILRIIKTGTLFQFGAYTYALKGEIALTFTESNNGKSNYAPYESSEPMQDSISGESSLNELHPGYISNPPSERLILKYNGYVRVSSPFKPDDIIFSHR